LFLSFTNSFYAKSTVRQLKVFFSSTLLEVTLRSTFENFFSRKLQAFYFIIPCYFKSYKEAGKYFVRKQWYRWSWCLCHISTRKSELQPFLMEV